MFKVYFCNHFYFSANTFKSVDEAIAYSKSTCFETSVYNSNGDLVATWSPLSGTRVWNVPK